MSLPENGEVMTLCGWKPYRNLRKTRINAPLVEVKLSNGNVVRCTPEHMWLTENGWKSARDLQKGIAILSSSTTSRSISRVVSIVYSLVQTGISGIRNICTVMCGLAPLARFPRGAISTIGMGTGQTIDSITWNVSQRLSIYPEPGMKQNTRGINDSQIKRERLRQHGTVRLPVGNGTGGMLNEPNRGRNGNGSRRTALYVEMYSRLLSAQTIVRNIVVAIANPLRVVSTEECQERADVWCMTVPDEAHFCLSDGAIVHNSHGADALRTGAGVTGKEHKHRRPRELPEVAVI